MFRAHFIGGLLQHISCFIGTTLGQAKTCRACEMRYTCSDYKLRQMFLRVAYNNSAFYGTFKLDVE